MEEDLLGHLLKANDPATQRAVEERLAADPDVARDLARLRAAFAPLAAACEDFDVPPDLWVRTLTRVAEHIVAEEGAVAAAVPSRTEEMIRRAAAIAEPPTKPAGPLVPAGPPPSDGAPVPARRRNIFAAVGLAAAVLALLFPAVVHIRARNQQLACQDTMREFHQAAVRYSDEHGGQFPQVTDGKQAATAAEALRLAGYLPADLRFTCPAARPDDAAPVVLANYAYSLGYREATGELHGLTRGPDNDLLPILADAPRRVGAQAIPLNHRYGQNVLFAAGNVRFCTNANVGKDGDDIFCNADGKVGAGLHKWDTALGRPEERP
ncbi:MAG TPA: hypothetical protein VKD90_16315 [Gemmataceae bacterium]|nr:hypothetical protein [Gemmataceae bacterium]